MMSNRQIVSALLGLAVGGACTAESLDKASVGSTSQAVHRTNGVRMNGVRMNGVRMNGVRMNGVRMNGVRMNGVRMNGTLLSGFTLEGKKVNGLDFIGVEFEAEMANGTIVYLVVDNIQLDPNDLDGDTYLYTVSFLNEKTAAWENICEDENGLPTTAIPLVGRWADWEGYDEYGVAGGSRIDDKDSLTLACRGAALAKCVEWGYKPWRTAMRCDVDTNTCVEVSLVDYHQSCTRMVRADYCGDGRAFTVDGTPIDAFDGIPIQESEMPAWALEAEWGEDGATCVDDYRLQLWDGEPECVSRRMHPDCGDGYHYLHERASRMVTKFAPRGLEAFPLNANLLDPTVVVKNAALTATNLTTSSLTAVTQ
jgi:uncharacterized protein YjbI with pentapeptide repeats